MARSVRNRRGVAGGLALALGILASSAVAAPDVSTIEPASLVRAQAIRAAATARYRALPGSGLRVSEASSTGVVDSFALLTPDLVETRFLPADNGVWYAICPVRATCPYPAPRVARPAADLVPRRLALELALHTFLETSAHLVAVLLPSTRYVVFIVGRDELAEAVDMRALSEALSGDPARALSSSLADAVDRLTRPRVFLALGLWPGPEGGDTWVGIPRWPTDPAAPAPGIAHRAPRS